jgi:hypothetical protein
VFDMGASGAGKTLGQTTFESRPSTAHHRGEADVDPQEVHVTDRERVSIPE